MSLWNRAPLVRLLFPFLIGIIIAIYISFKSDFTTLLIFILFFVIAAFVFIKRLNLNYKRSWFFGAVVNLAMLLTGYQLTGLRTLKLDLKHFSNITTEGKFFIKITEPYLEKEKSLKITAEVLSIAGSNRKTTGKVILYIRKDAKGLNLKYGDCLFIRTKFNEVPPPQNPGEFNYKRFLSFHNIYHQTYVRPDDWKFSGINKGHGVFNYSFGLRDQLLNVFKENNIRGDEYAVGAALLLGYEDKLDADMISAYSSTGALHVLSVSGLHVAIVYIVFFKMLFFLNRFRYGRFIKTITLLLLLWFYAALTGLSPAVLRATAMFSFIVVGQAYKFNTNIYNTLAASAFFLLMINPFLIMQVGFQLSYLAVIGIVFIQPMIYEKFETDNWLLDQIWAITAVSIAAQIATFPLGLHYFHQFPCYFLLSNLIVIPVSTLIIYTGILLLAVAKITLIAPLIAKIFSFSVYFLNESVKYMEHLPYAIVEGVSITVSETWLIYFLIGFLFAFLLLKKYKYLLTSLSLLAFMLLLQAAEKIAQKHQKKIIVYNTPKAAAYEFISGTNNLLIADSALLHNKSRMLFHVKHNWWDNGIKNERLAERDTIQNLCENCFFYKAGMIKFYDRQLVVISKKLFPSSKKISADYIILSSDVFVKIKQIKDRYNFKQIIFDSSNSKWRVNKWKEECKSLNINYYSVLDNGAFILEI